MRYFVSGYKYDWEMGGVVCLQNFTRQCTRVPFTTRNSEFLAMFSREKHCLLCGFIYTPKGEGDWREVTTAISAIISYLIEARKLAICGVIREKEKKENEVRTKNAR